MGGLMQRAWELDPTVLADAARTLPAWLGWVLVLVGLACAGFGAWRGALRITVGSVAALVGWTSVGLVLDAARFGVTPVALSWAGATTLGILGAVWPIAAGFVIGGIAGGLFFQRWMPFEDTFLRSIPGAGACGALSGLCTRPVACLVSAFLGAVAVAVGCASMLLHGGYADWLDPHPVVTLLPFSLVFVSGAAFQLTRREPPQEKESPQVRPGALSGGGAA